MRKAANTANCIGIVLGFASLAAAVIHFSVMGDHFSEYAPFGVFFATVAWLQLLWGVAITMRRTRTLLLAGALVNCLVIAVWAVSRTRGLPIGPGAGTPEVVSSVDLVSVVLEAVIVVGCVALLVRPGLARARLSVPAAVSAVGATGLAIAVGTTLALTPAAASAHHAHAHDAAATQPATAGLAGEAGGVEGHHHSGPTPHVPLKDRNARLLLANQLERARAAAMQNPTIAAAASHGYQPYVPYIAGMGSHWINWPSFTNTFDVDHPAMLLYDGNGPDAQVVGVSYVVNTGGAAPPGFVGADDVWHEHLYCARPHDPTKVIKAAGTSESACRRRHGVFIGKGVWMLHVWVVPGWEDTSGTFAFENPDLT